MYNGRIHTINFQINEAKTFKEWASRAFMLEDGQKSCGYCSFCIPMIKAVKIATVLLVVSFILKIAC